jgi:endo-1,4-beta-xylanase
MHLKLLPALVLGIAVAGCGGDDTQTNPASGGSSGGTPASGGVANTGGAGPTGGTAIGGTATGGSGGMAGGDATGGKPAITSSCTEADETFTDNASGEHCGYTYEYWKDKGTGTLVLKPDGFSVEWSNINNLLGRKGIRPGSADLVVNYEADYKPSGNSYLTIYGWTKNPLIEYYIVDSWGTWRPPGDKSIGTVTSDGGTYDIYKTQRVDQPSIEGNKTTFYQYWSVRKEKRTSGTITVGNHFKAWADKGMNMGSFYEVSMTVEGYQSSGKAAVKMSIQ